MDIDNYFELKKILHFLILNQRHFTGLITVTYYLIS